MTASTCTFRNPYWDAVADMVTEDAYYGRCVGYMEGRSPRRGRHDLTDRYAWSVSDPDTVAFVVEHCGSRVLDPLAGSGYWAWLLTQLGVDVSAHDLNPPRKGGNNWHQAGREYVDIWPGDAKKVVRTYGHDRTLLLSWPPYSDPIGALVLAAYPGDRVVYMGEGEGGCCGDDDMFEVFERNWRKVAEHKPVQWYGLHDYVVVYERKGSHS